jgi:hypothetical protein
MERSVVLVNTRDPQDAFGPLMMPTDASDPRKPQVRNGHGTGKRKTKTAGPLSSTRDFAFPR